MVQKSELLKEIQLAFSQNERFDSQNVVRGDSIEAGMVKNLLSKRSWAELDAAALSAYDNQADLSAVIAFLSPEGFRYYLPSFLSFIVNQFNTYGLLIDSLISKLASGATGYGPEIFTPAEKLAVSRFLSYLRERFPNDESMGRDIDNALKLWS